MRRMEPAKNFVWGRSVCGARGLVAGSGEGCGEDKGIFCASGMGAARDWRNDSGGLRASGVGGRVPAAGDGSDVDGSSVLSGEGVCGDGDGGRAAGGWADAADGANGEERGRLEGRRQRSEVRGQRFEVRGSRSEVDRKSTR